MSEQTKIGGKALDDVNNLIHNSVKNPSLCIAIAAHVREAFARVAELEAERDMMAQMNRGVRDEFLRIESERDALKAEVERLRLPYVKRREPPDRDGLWMYDSGKFGSVGVTRIYQGGSGLRTSLGEDPAKLDCLWGSAPLPVGEVEG